MAIDNNLCEYYIIDPENETTIQMVQNYHIFGRDILQAMLNEIDAWNWKDDDTSYVENIRWTIMDLMIRFENTNIINDGYNIFKNAMDSNNISVIPDIFLRQIFEAAFYKAAVDDDMEIYDELMDVYYNTSDTDIRNRWLEAVGYAYKNEQFVDNIYEFIMSDDVDSTSKTTGLNSLANGCYSRQYLWNNLKKNAFEGIDMWRDINTNAAINSLQAFANSEVYIEAWNYYYVVHNFTDNIATNNTLQLILRNIGWINNNAYQDQLFKYLDDYVNGGDDDEEPDEEEVILVWILSGVGLILFIIIIAVIYAKCCKKKPTMPNYYEMEKHQSNYGTMVRDLYK